MADQLRHRTEPGTIPAETLWLPAVYADDAEAHLRSAVDRLGAAVSSESADLTHEIGAVNQLKAKYQALLADLGRETLRVLRGGASGNE